MGDAVKKNNKIALYSPYLDILGGGERYLLTLAEYFSKENSVTVFWKERGIISRAKEKLGLDISKVEISALPHGTIQRFFDFRKFNIFFHMTDASLMWVSSNANYLIIQSPAHIPKTTFINSLKLQRYDQVICYSNFVAEIIRKRLKLNPKIISPPVDDSLVKETHKKQNMILSVGRFFPWLHSKKQDVLIEAFRLLINKYQQFENWSLELVGSVDKGGQQYLNEVISKSVGLPVKVHLNISYNELKDCYSRAKIYWHASGFGEDLEKYPEKAEHFGITTIEAMAAGAIPLVFNGGGQKEIVKDGYNGFTWTEISELINKTQMITKNRKKTIEVSNCAIKTSHLYTRDRFINSINKILNAE